MIGPIRNVFDDLAATPEKAENLKIRARLMDGLRAYVGKRELTQAEAAERLRMRAPVSHRAGSLAGMSSDRGT